MEFVARGHTGVRIDSKARGPCVTVFEGLIEIKKGIKKCMLLSIFHLKKKFYVHTCI